MTDYILSETPENIYILNNSAQGIYKTNRTL